MQTKRRFHYKLLAALIILLVAAFLRIVTFQRYLPFTDYADEPNMYMVALDWRGSELGKLYGAHRVTELFGGYPPLYVWIQMGMQQLLESTATKNWLASGEIIFWMRLIAIGMGLLTTALIFDTGALIGGTLTGTIAGVVWATAPPIVEYNSVAIPDPLVYLSCAAALWCAIRAIKFNAPVWMVYSFIAAIVAIYAKYVPIYVLIPPFVAFVVLARRNFPQTIRYGILCGIIGAIAAAYLFYSLTVLPLVNGEADLAREKGADLLFNLERNRLNLQSMLIPIGNVQLLIALVIAAAAWFFARRENRLGIPWAWIGLLVLYLLPVVPIASLVASTGGGVVGASRHVMPGTYVVSLLWALLIAQTYYLLRGHSQWLRSGIVAVLVAIWLIPAIAGDMRLINRFQYPHTITRLWQWSDASIPPEGMILATLEGGVSIAWNRPWSGYNGTTDFQWFIEEIQLDKSPEDYFNRGLTYLAVSDHDIKRWKDNPQSKQFIDQLFHIKTIPQTIPEAGPTINFYRMRHPQVPANTVFGDQIALVGYDLSSPELVPGQEFVIRPYWRATRRPDANYSMFIHLLPESSLDSQPVQPFAQADGAPSTPRRLPLSWDDPSEIHFGSGAKLQIPDSLPPGEYRLLIGLYNYETGQRLLTGEGADSFTILLKVQAS